VWWTPPGIHGHRIECDRASFLWHERDAQGNLIAANEQFAYRMGTLCLYMGTVHDDLTFGDWPSS
jgi:hypothetical protein